MSRGFYSLHGLRQRFAAEQAAMVPDSIPRWWYKFPVVSAVIHRIGISEFRRRLFHMSPSLLTFAFPLLPEDSTRDGSLVAAIVLLSFAVLVFAAALRPLLMRPCECTWMQAVLGFMTPVVTPLLLMPGRPEFGLITLQVLALGDGAATLGGLLLGGPFLPWNRRKTYAGLFCFAISALIGALYVFWQVTHLYSMDAAIVICTVTALCAAVVESLPLATNDNLRVGATALLVATVLGHWFV